MKTSKYISGETFEETFKLINDSLAFVGITKTEFAKKDEHKQTELLFLEIF